ncbi:MAG: hypothetical protein H3C62_00335 [Gemmatimonadaceae bacterium]|nr:hypothetical protein [Gemmatimonadaceae bacterium]
MADPYLITLPRADDTRRQASVEYHLVAEMAGPPALHVERLLAAVREWAGWRLPPLRHLVDVHARVVVRTPAGQWCFVEPLWRDDALLLWDVTWRVRVGDGSWCTRLRVMPFGHATRISVRSEMAGLSAEQGASLIVGGEGACASPESLVTALASDGALLVDHVPIRAQARTLTGEHAASFVSDELADPLRRLPVVVLSALRTLTSAGGAVYVIPPDSLAAALVGRAHVIALASHAVSYAFTDAVNGRERSAYLGAARIYQPGFAPTTHDPGHALISEMRLRTEGIGAIRHLVPVPLWPIEPDSLELAALRDERTSQTGARVVSDGADPSSSAARIAELSSTLAALQVERATMQQELAELREALDDTDDEVAEASDTPLSVLVEVQAAYHDVLAVHPLALRSASESPFEGVESLRKALTALGDLARAARTNGGLGQDLRTSFGVRGVDFMPHLTEAALSGRFRRQFVRRWNGQTHVCADHLRLGNSYDPRYCLRVYFDWSARDALGRVLIGHCGRHLDIPSTT